MKGIERIFLLGIPIDGYTYTTWLDQIAEWIHHPSTHLHQICTVNPEFLMIAQKDAEFFKLLRRVDANVPDGTGLLIGAKLIGQSLPSRVTGSDGLPRLALRAAEAGWRIYFLGAAEGVADLTATKLKQANPHLPIAGVYAGSPADEEVDAIIEKINASKADILLVAYGAPKQDLWIDKHRDRLNVKVAIGVGGAFDYISGIVPRAPGWMRQLGLEWVYRLYKQPWRWRRMVRLPLFVIAVLRYRDAATPSARKGK